MTLLSLAPPAAPRCPAHQGQGPALCTSSPSLITPHALWRQPCNQITIDPSLLLNQCHRLGTGGPIQTPLQEMEDCMQQSPAQACPPKPCTCTHAHTLMCTPAHSNCACPLTHTHAPLHTQMCTHMCPGRHMDEYVHTGHK